MSAGVNWTEQMLKRQQEDRDRQHQELEGKTDSILNDVKELQKRRASLPPDSPDIANIDKALQAHQQAFTDLYHPTKNPNALQHLGRFLEKHVARKEPAPLPQSNAVTPERMAGLQASAAGTQQNPYELKKRALIAAGVPEDEATRLATGQKDPKEGAEKVGLWMKDAKGNMLPAQIQGGKAVPIGLPEGMSAVGGAGKLRETVEPDTDSPSGYSKVAYDLVTGEEVSRQSNVLPPRGFIGSESKTVDPFGVTSTTTRTPVLPGGKSQTNTPSAPSPIASPGDAKKRAKEVAPLSRQLDESGHIPATAKANPLLREAANQLIDGKDIDKLGVPMKDREGAAQLARSYGWKGQGLFGPKDQLLIRESTGILKQLAASPALSVLDDTASRLKIQQVLENPEKRGMIGGMVQNIAAQNLTEPEQQFVTLYNQAVGRISGLSQLVRSGRATEAQIERLKTELPNPATTSSSAHAKQKLAQIQNEIDIALEKGQFVESPEGGGPKKHRIKIGDKRYEYKGTGDTADLANYTEVTQ